MGEREKKRKRRKKQKKKGGISNLKYWNIKIEFNFDTLLV